jgi:dTDP-4-amino-4,6-dideoxygalactose transaminase
MDELHAAIGRVQLRKLTGIVAGRRAFVQLLKDKGIGKFKSISIPEVIPGAEHSYWWWRLGFNGDELRCTKEEFFAALTAEGLAVSPSYNAALPYTFEWFKDLENKHPWNNPLYKGNAVKAPETPNAFEAMKNNFNLTVAESWGEKEADDIIAIIEKVEKAYLK